MSTVDSGGGNGLSRRHLRVGTGQRQNELHIAGGRRSRVVVCSQGNGHAGVNQSTGRRKFLQPEKIIFGAEYSLFECVAVLTYLFAAGNTGEEQ